MKQSTFNGRYWSVRVWLIALLPVLSCCTGECDDHLLYLSLQGEDRVVWCRIDSGTGELEGLDSLKVDGSPACLALHPSGNFIYVAQREKRTISALGVDRETGALQILNTIPAGNPVYLSTDRTGRYLLAAFNEPLPGIEDRMRAAIYRIREDGLLVKGAVQEISTGLKPHSITTDPTNRFLYIPCLPTRVSSCSSGLMRLPIGIPAGSSRDGGSAGDRPRHFAFHGKLNIIYFVNETNGTVTSYRIHRENGSLSPFQTITTLPDGFSGNNISADIHLTPDDRFLYATNRRDENSIAAFRVHPATGDLGLIGIFPTEPMPRESDRSLPAVLLRGW